MSCRHPRLGDRLVVIIGGGIGGLALALQKDGANVRVYERNTAGLRRPAEWLATT